MATKYQFSSVLKAVHCLIFFNNNKMRHWKQSNKTCIKHLLRNIIAFFKDMMAKVGEGGSGR